MNKMKILNWMNKFVSKIFPYLFWFILLLYFSQLFYFMVGCHLTLFLYSLLGPIDYIVYALYDGTAIVLGWISDIIFDDNLILNEKYTTLGDANATDIQALIFEIEEYMELISDKLIILQDIVHSPEFIVNLQSHGDIVVRKFSVITFLIDSTLHAWTYLEMLEHTFVNSFYTMIYSMSDIYVTNHFWRIFNDKLSPFVKLILGYFLVYLQTYLMDLTEMIQFCEKIQASPIMSVKDMTVNLEYFRIIFESHKNILVSSRHIYGDYGNLFTLDLRKLPYTAVEPYFYDWLHQINKMVTVYKDFIEVPDKSFLYWLRKTHKEAHPQLL